MEILVGNSKISSNGVLTITTKLRKQKLSEGWKTLCMRNDGRNVCTKSLLTLNQSHICFGHKLDLP